MTVHEAFLYCDLTPADQVVFAKLIQAFICSQGRTTCWHLSQIGHNSFEGFSSIDPRRVKYKNNDARPLLLAMVGQFADGCNNVAVRKASCGSNHCLNPTHYYWGTRQDASYETAVRSGTAIPFATMGQMRRDQQNGIPIKKIAHKYKVPYHTARRICKEETYTDLQSAQLQRTDSELWGMADAICSYIVERYPRESKEFNFNFRVVEKTTCPWHRKNQPGHKGNFGLMGECLDCMEEIRKGRCRVDVTQFDLDWYWTIKRFWDHVAIKSENECWPWLGTTRRNNSESIAYFPSPHHSGKTQSAPRVAYWLSRGYTGKYKVFSKPDCQAFCCNPTHLTIREFKDMLPPAKIDTIQLKHTNIFEHARKNLAQNQPGPAQ